MALRGIASKSGEAATDTLFLVSQPKLESSASDNAPSYMHNVGKTVNTAGDIFAAPTLEVSKLRKFRAGRIDCMSEMRAG